MVTNPCCDGWQIWGIEVEQAVPPSAAKYFPKIANGTEYKHVHDTTTLYLVGNSAAPLLVEMHHHKTNQVCCIYMLVDYQYGNQFEWINSVSHINSFFAFSFSIRLH